MEPRTNWWVHLRGRIFEVPSRGMAAGHNSLVSCVDTTVVNGEGERSSASWNERAGCRFVNPVAESLQARRDQPGSLDQSLRRRGDLSWPDADGKTESSEDREPAHPDEASTEAPTLAGVSAIRRSRTPAKGWALCLFSTNRVCRRGLAQYAWLPEPDYTRPRRMHPLLVSPAYVVTHPRTQ